jgi:hypothetical protein
VVTRLRATQVARKVARKLPLRVPLKVPLLATAAFVAAAGVAPARASQSPPTTNTPPTTNITAPQPTQTIPMEGSDAAGGPPSAPSVSSSPPSSSRPAKAPTTKRKRKATTTTVAGKVAGAGVVRELPAGSTVPAPTSVAQVTAGKGTTSAVSAKGFDETITTVLAPDKVPNSVPDEVWLALRKCESNNRYDINTGNGYYGAYQFAAGTWRNLGYSGLPHRAAPVVQDEAAKRLQAKAGWGPWPACTRKLGLR